MSYSHEIANAIDTHLKNNDWKYRFMEDAGIFEFKLGTSGKAKFLNYHILVHEHGFTVLARYPLGPEVENARELDATIRFLTRTNYGLRNGNFEMDLDDGELRYKVYCMCRDIVPSDGMIFESIHCPSAMFDKYGPGILGILFSDFTEKEATEKCENEMGGMRSRLEAMLRRKAEEKEAEEDAEDDTSDEDDDDDSGDSASALSDYLRMLISRSAAEADEDEDEDEDDDFEIVEDDDDDFSLDSLLDDDE